MEDESLASEYFKNLHTGKQELKSKQVPKLKYEDSPPQTPDEANLAGLSTDRRMLELNVDVRPSFWEPEKEIFQEKTTQREDFLDKEDGPIGQLREDHLLPQLISNTSHKSKNPHLTIEQSLEQIFGNSKEHQTREAASASEEIAPIIKVENGVVKIQPKTVADFHCSRPYRDRRVFKSIVYLVGSMLYLCTMAGFTIYYSRADFEC